MPALSTFAPAAGEEFTNDWLKTVFPVENPYARAAATPERIDTASNAGRATRRMLLTRNCHGMVSAMRGICQTLQGRAWWQSTPKTRWQFGNPDSYSVQSVIDRFPSFLHSMMGPALAAHDGVDNLQRRAWYAIWLGVWRAYTKAGYDASSTRELLRDLAKFIIDTRGKDDFVGPEYEEVRDYLNI